MFPNRCIYWEKGLVKVYMKDKSSFSSQLRIGTFFNYEAIGEYYRPSGLYSLPKLVTRKQKLLPGHSFSALWISNFC